MEQVHAYTEEELTAMNWAFEKSGAPTEELFVHVDYSVLGTTASQEVIDTFKGARAIVLDNAPTGMPTMFLRGKDLSNGLTFFNIAAVSEDDGTYLPILASIGVQTSDPFLVTSVIIRDDVKYGFVRYDEPQTLTDVQKDQARANIGAKSPTELIADDTFVSDLAQTENIGIGLALNAYFVSEILGNNEFLTGLGRSPEIYEAYMQSLVQDASVLNSIGSSPNTAALRYVAQTLTAVQQMQVYTNLGLKVYVTNSSILGTTVSAAVGAALRAATILLFADTNETYFLGSSNPSRFYSFFNSGYIKEIFVSDANVVSTVSSRSYVDNLAVHFTAQSLSEAQKLQARTNIGVETPLEIAENTQFQQKLCEQPTFAQALMIPVVGIISDDDVLEAIAAAMASNVTLAAVRYVTQNLTDAQKTTARNNIGVPTSTELASDTALINGLARNVDFTNALTGYVTFLTTLATKLTANETAMGTLASSLMDNAQLAAGLATNVDFLNSLLSNNFPMDLAANASFQNELLNDANFITQLKAKLGIA